jgi:biopolymer transport protein ExbB
MRLMATRWLLIAAVTLGAAAAHAQGTAASSSAEAKSLAELLELVERGLEVEREENRRRVDQFKQQKQDQERVLAEARATLAGEEDRSQRLETGYNENEVVLAQDQQRLTERLGQLGELFGVVRMVATDTSANVASSLTTSQLGERTELLDRLGRSKALPSTADLEKLWFELQREMTEQGRIVRYRAPVLTAEGQTEQRDVIRAGPFTAISKGRYLLWASHEKKLLELGRQPPARYLNTVASFEQTTSGYAKLAVDPTRGSLLTALTATPSRIERVQQGKTVGFLIISLGSLAFVLGMFRLVIVLTASAKVNRQRRRTAPDAGNPLGRVLGVYEENRNADTETLELKLDEAVLKESTKLESLMWIVKTMSVIAPLMGLLGTVTGMIQTFQAITLFGAGDPKMMAGGISEALVTTMLGLITAIPLVLLYDTLSNSARRVIDILDEQSAGLIAMRAQDTNV